MRRVEDLVPAPYNPRSISKRAMKGLKASLSRFGLVEPLVLNKRTGYLVGGHQRLKVLLDSGVEEAPVVIVDLPDAEEKALNITLNSDKVAGDFDEGLNDLLAGLQDPLGDMFADLNLDDLLGSGEGVSTVSYTSKITAPIYEPKGRKPAVDRLFDNEKTQELLDEIEEAKGIPADVKRFLRLAAERHTSFHFGRIAEFYAHSPAPVQELMERSALVIIDLDKAIENGFTQMVSELGALEQEDQDAG